jgi:trans-aconitate methyltransferase
MDKWTSYYQRTAKLPDPTLTQDFLDHIPLQGSILDFGTGSGRWSAAFLRDRPDLTIDTIDQNIHRASLLAEPWPGQKIQSSFQDFVPPASYDGIWAWAVLFFLPGDELKTCFHKLATALKQGGVISFSMVDDCDTSRELKFHGQSKESTLQMMSSENLNIIAQSENLQAVYAEQKVIVPTWYITASKP